MPFTTFASMMTDVMPRSSEAHPDSASPLPKLPTELFIHILDQLTEADNGRRLAFELSDPVTRTLRALMLVSRNMYLIASKYLYSRCIYIQRCEKFHMLRRTLRHDLELERHPLTLITGAAARSDRLFSDAGTPKYITAISLSMYRRYEGDFAGGRRKHFATPSHLINFFNAIGANLRKLSLNLKITSEHYMGSDRSLFSNMTQLEELVVNSKLVHFYEIAPPKLRRLAITSGSRWPESPSVKFCLSSLLLEKLFIITPRDFGSSHMDVLYSEYKGTRLDVVFVVADYLIERRVHTRDWPPDDAMRIWLWDVQTVSYTENRIDVCDKSIWARSLDGTMWNQEYLRLASSSEPIKKHVRITSFIPPCPSRRADRGP
jgi:hypothetical protein